MNSQREPEEETAAKDIHVRCRRTGDVRIVIRAKKKVDDDAVLAVIDRWLAQSIAKKIAQEMTTAGPGGPSKKVMTNPESGPKSI